MSVPIENSYQCQLNGFLTSVVDAMANRDISNRCNIILVTFDYQKGRDAWAKVANAISKFEKTKMIVHPKDSASAKVYYEKIDIIEFPINDAWSRDSGAIFLLDHNHGLAGGFRF